MSGVSAGRQPRRGDHPRRRHDEASAWRRAWHALRLDDPTWLVEGLRGIGMVAVVSLAFAAVCFVLAVAIAWLA